MDVFELLDKNFDLCKQVDALNVMIYREKILFYGVSHFSFAQIFEKNLLRLWDCSMGRVSFEELLCDLGLYDYDYTKNVIKMPNNEQEAVLCLQLNINMILYAKNHKIAFDNFTWDSYKFFMETQKKYEYIMNKAGLQLIRNSKKNYMMIVPRDEKVRSVAETTDNDTAILLYEFTSPIFKGNYKKKREILKLLANKIEPICKKYRTIYKSGLGFNIFNDLGTILNNFEIRHSNLDPNDVNNFKEPLTKYTSKDWEEIYDIAYQMILDAFLVDKYNNIYSKTIQTHKDKIGLKK